MPKLTDFQDTDKQYDPYSNENARDLLRQDTEAGLNTAPPQTGPSTNDSKNSSRNIDATKQAEEEAGAVSNQFNWNESKSGANQQKNTVGIRTVLKKKGPLAAIITLGLGLPTLLTIMFSPALLLQQLSETMTGKFNDQLAAVDARSTLLLKKKYNSTITKGLCSPVTIKCKYQSIRENSGLAKRLKNAGVEIKGDSSIIPGRIKPAAFIFDGNEIAAKDLVKEARTNPALRSALRKGYDPLFAAFSDKISAKVRAKLGLKRSSNVKSSKDPAKMDEDLKKAASGTNEVPTNAQKLNEKKENGKVTGYTDSEGKLYTVEQGQSYNSMIDESIGRNKLAEKLGNTALKSTVKGVFTSTALGLGSADTLCTGWVMLRVAGFAAKVYQQRQLIRYSYEFMKISHKQKYGDLTAEEMTYFGDKLTKANSEGKAALDSDGYRYAAYGDVFTPASFESVAKEGQKDQEIGSSKAVVQNETSRYVNGQLLNDNMMTELVKALTVGRSHTVEAADDVCKFTKSWKGQTLLLGLAAAGVAVAVITGGASATAGVALNVTASLTISVAFALIQPKLIDMAKGEVIKGDENGNETGNAITAGMGGYNAEASQGRGLRPASEQAYAAYNQQTTNLVAEYDAADRASRSPFDATSKNTFVGSIINTLLPYTTKMQTVGSSSLAVASLVTSTLSSLTRPPTTAAATKAEQFSQCDDHEYKGYAADPFCNLRYMLPDKETDPDKVLDYMIKGGYITAEDATPLGEYAAYVERCIDRKSSIGDPYTEDGGVSDTGTDCVVGQGGANEKRNTMFALFYVDQSVDEGLDNDFDADLGTGSSGAGANLSIASFNVRGASHDGDNGTINYVTRMKRTVQTIQMENFDVIGFQEFETRQRKEFNKSAVAGNYKLSSSDSGEDNGNAIGWNTSKYDLISQGTQPDLVYTTGGKLKAPWVKLRDKSTGQEFYFLNTHDPANVHDNPVTKNAARRTANAKSHVEFMRSKAAEGVPVFITGDFNSSFDKRGGDVNVNGGNIKQTLPYCIMTADGSIKNAFDMYKNRPVKCPNNDIKWKVEDPGKGCSTQIDHLYIATAGMPITVPGFGCVKKGDTQGSVSSGNGSDHDTVKFSVAIGGGESSEGTGGAGELSWPMSKTLYHSNKLDWLNAHGSTGTAWGGDNMGTSGKGAYIAADISSKVGVPVYAMLGGTVTSTSLCGENDGIAIKSSIGGGTLGIAYMHGRNKKFKKGDKVRTGQQIMEVGSIGCKVFGSHLHIGMAYNGKYICPQDTFLALDKNTPVDWQQLVGKASGGCGR